RVTAAVEFAHGSTDKNVGMVNAIEYDGGRGRTRTGTPVSQKQILSLLCLPFHHAAPLSVLSFIAHIPKACDGLRRSISISFSKPFASKLVACAASIGGPSCVSRTRSPLWWARANRQARGWAMAAPRYCALSRREPGFLRSTTLLPRPKKPPPWRARAAVANAWRLRP